MDRLDFWPRAVFPMKRSLNAATYNYILDNGVLPVLWYQCVIVPVLFQHDKAPVKKWFSQFHVEELDSSDLIQHRGDKLEHQL